MNFPLCNDTISLTTHSQLLFFFFFNDTATTEIYTLSLHDALPISTAWTNCRAQASTCSPSGVNPWKGRPDRKSTRLNSSHLVISYAVFCLKKKKRPTRTNSTSQRAG